MTLILMIYETDIGFASLTFSGQIDFLNKLFFLSKLFTKNWFEQNKFWPNFFDQNIRVVKTRVPWHPWYLGRFEKCRKNWKIFKLCNKNMIKN